MPMKPNETMTYLAERVREILGRDPRVTEKHMFGGLTFLLDGHILVGTKKDGRILLSVGRQNNDAALSRPGATPMVHNNRSMTGFVWVEADAIEDDDDLRDWVQTAYDWVANLPAADPKASAEAFNLDLGASAEDAAATAPADAPAQTGKAAKRFGLDTPIAELLADYRAKSVLDKDMPGLSTDKNLDKVKPLSLNKLAPLSGGRLSPELLAKVGKDLAKID